MTDIADDAARKAFYTAFERTQRRIYEPEEYRREASVIYKDVLGRTCETCPERNTTCTELCPEIMRYVDQDAGKRKNRLTTKGADLQNFSQNSTENENFLAEIIDGAKE